MDQKAKTKEILKPIQIKKKLFSSPKAKPAPKPAAKPEEKPNQQAKTGNMIFIIVIVFAVIVALVFVLTDLGKEANGNGKPSYTCPDGTIVSSQEDCPVNGIPPEQKLSFDERYALCLNKSVIQDKDSCLQELAVEFNKEELCDELVNLDKEKCFRAVLRASAVVSTDTEKCNDLITEFDRIECIKEIALLTLDKTVCDKLSDSTTRNSCLTELAIEKEDLTVCDSIKTSAVETCKFNTILVIADASLCNFFALPTIKNDCISRIAEKLNDVSLCNLISDSVMQGRCVGKFS